jgi:hypothetical protein
MEITIYMLGMERTIVFFLSFQSTFQRSQQKRKTVFSFALFFIMRSDFPVKKSVLSVLTNNLIMLVILNSARTKEKKKL